MLTIGLAICAGSILFLAALSYIVSAFAVKCRWDSWHVWSRTARELFYGGLFMTTLVIISFLVVGPRS